MRHICAVALLCALSLTVGGWSLNKEIPDEDAALVMLAFLNPKDSEDEKVVASFLESSGLAEHAEELIGKAKEFHAYKLHLEDRVKRGESTDRATNDLRGHIAKQTADLKQKPKIEGFIKALKTRINKKENDYDANDDSLPVPIDGACHPN